MTRPVHPSHRSHPSINSDGSSYGYSVHGAIARRRPDRRVRSQRQGTIPRPATARPPAQGTASSRQPRLKPVAWYRQIITRRLRAFSLAILYTVLRVEAGLRRRAGTVLDVSGRALHSLRALLSFSPFSFFVRDTVSVAVFLADRRERVFLERQLCSTLRRLRRSAITLDARARVVVVVQYSLDGVPPPASMTRVLPTPGPETLLISLALYVDGQRLTTDEVVSHLTTRYIDLVSSYLVASAVERSIASDVPALVPTTEVGTLPSAERDDTTTATTTSTATTTTASTATTAADGLEQATPPDPTISEVAALSERSEAPVSPPSVEDTPAGPAADALLGYVTARARLAGATADDQVGQPRPDRASGSRSARRAADRGAARADSPE